MKRAASLALALAVLVLGPVAHAAKSRTVTGEYNTLVVSDDLQQGHYSNGVDFRTKKGERFVSIELEDRSGEMAFAVLGQDLDGDGIRDTEHEICGATDSPIAFEPGINVRVYAQEGTCGGEPTVSTLGKVTATFTR